MPEQIYAAPNADMEETIPEKNHNPFLTLLFGFLLDATGTILTVTCLGAVFFIYLHSSGVAPEEIMERYRSDPYFGGLQILIGFFFALWSGFFVAKRSAKREYIFAMWLSVVNILVIGIEILFVEASNVSQMGWQEIVSYAFQPVMIFIGSWLYVCSRKRT